MEILPNPSPAAPERIRSERPPDPRGISVLRPGGAGRPGWRVDFAAAGMRRLSFVFGRAEDAAAAVRILSGIESDRLAA